MVEFIIFGRDIPWSKLQGIIEKLLELAKEQNKSPKETAEDIIKAIKEFLNDQKIWMKKQDN